MLLIIRVVIIIWNFGNIFARAELKEISFEGNLLSETSAIPSPSEASVVPAPSATSEIPSPRHSAIPAPSADPAQEPISRLSPGTSFSSCGPPGDLDAKITRKRLTSVCIEFVSPRSFSSGSSSQTVRALFDPISDSLSSVTVKQSYSKFNVSLESTLIVASSFQSSSAISSLTGAIPGGAKYYINSDQGHIFNLYTVIITVLSGKVTLVSFEEGCLFCQNSHDCSINAPDSTPFQKSCHLTVKDCIDNENGGNACDLTLFIVWRGDDSYNSPFTSAGRRPSRFAMFPVAGKQILEQIKHI
jgi:hypothetical protein